MIILVKYTKLQSLNKQIVKAPTLEQTPFDMAI